MRKPGTFLDQSGRPDAVGACKGTVEAIEAADLLVCLHGAFFTGWVQRIREAGTRVVLAVDHPDDLEQLMAPPGLKEQFSTLTNGLRTRR